MIRFMLLSAFFLQHISLAAMNIEQVNNKLVLKDDELSLLNESLKLMMPDQKVLFEVVGALSNAVFDTLSKSPFEKWIYYCATTNSLGFPQLLAKMILSIGHYNTSQNIETLTDSVFWKSLSLFQFNTQELYVFKLIFIQSLQKSLRLGGTWRPSNNSDKISEFHLVNSLLNILDENKFLKIKHEELTRPWEKILNYMIAKISQNSSENAALSGIKQVVIFDETELIYKTEKISYSNISDITVETRENPLLVIITEEARICERIKMHKIKFSSQLEVELFAEYLSLIINLLNMNKTQTSDNLALLSSVYIAGLGYNNSQDLVKKSRSKGKEIQPLKLQQMSSSSSLSLSSPKKNGSGKQEINSPRKNILQLSSKNF